MLKRGPQSVFFTGLCACPCFGFLRHFASLDPPLPAQDTHDIKHMFFSTQDGPDPPKVLEKYYFCVGSPSLPSLRGSPPGRLSDSHNAFIL